MNRADAKMRSRYWVRLLIAMLILAIVACSLSFLAIRSEWNARIEEPDSIDVLIVLGAGVWGNRPSPQLQLRLESAASLYTKNPEMIVIVSGGQGPDELVSEAQAMHDALIDLGVSDQSILMENASTSTVENLRFSKVILDSLEFENPSIGIVTTDFHMYRAKMLARRFGMEAQGNSSPNIPIIVVKNTVREIAALIKDFLIR